MPKRAKKSAPSPAASPTPTPLSVGARAKPSPARQKSTPAPTRPMNKKKKVASKVVVKSIPSVVRKLDVSEKKPIREEKKLLPAMKSKTAAAPLRSRTKRDAARAKKRNAAKAVMPIKPETWVSAQRTVDSGQWTADSGQRTSRSPLNPYTKIAMMAVGIVALAATLFGAVKIMHPQPLNVLSRIATKNIPDEITTNDTFRGWIDQWRQVDPYVSRAEFAAAAPAPLAYLPDPVNPEEGSPDRSARYVWSSDKKTYLDYLAKYPSENAVVVSGAADGGTHTLDRVCSASCVVDGAFWTGQSQVVLLARVHAMKPDGMRLCVGADADGKPRCYERLAIESLDLVSGARTEYLSLPHFFATHPTDAARRARWASALLPEEQISAGVVPPENVKSVKGVVTAMTPEGTSFTLDMGSLGTQAVRVVAGTRIRDTHGEAVQFPALHTGFTLAISGLPAQDETLIADKIDITTAARVMITGPKTDDAVGKIFNVTGSAARDAWPLTLTLIDPRTGKVLAQKELKAPQSDTTATYLDFDQQLHIGKLGFKPDEKIRITLAPATGDGAADRECTYKP